MAGNVARFPPINFNLALMAEEEGEGEGEAYAESYSAEANKGKNLRVFVIAMVAPGNPFPIVENPYVDGKKNPEGYLGATKKQGFDSHYTIGIIFSPSLLCEAILSQIVLSQ